MSLTSRFGAFGFLVSLFLACPAPPKPAPPEPGPSIKSFSVSANRVARDQTVTFTFETERASAVTLLDEAGGTVTTSFDASTQRGSASTAVSKSSIYVLRAESPNGRDAAFVQVAVDEPLREVFLVVVPRVVVPGQRVDVVWSAAGGTSVQLRAGNRSLSTMAQGMAVDRPTTTTSYTLSARNDLNQTLMAEATVRVEPTIERFEASPPVARPGQVIALEYKTLGAETISVSEATFGELFSGPPESDGGVVSFTVPATFSLDAGDTADAGADGGAPMSSGLVRDGFPLRFTLRAETAMPMQVASATVNGRVGLGAIIDRFDVPSDVTTDGGLVVSWETTGATRIELWVNGISVYRPPPGFQLDASFSLPRVLTDTTFTLLAFDSTGLVTRATKMSTVVRAPVIAAFTMPATSSSPSTPVMASWQTQNTRVVVLRIKDGPTVFTSNASAQVAMGSARIGVGQTTTFVLEAYNAAGSRVTAERRVTQNNPVTVRATPNPTVSNGLVALSWDIGGLSATDITGLLPEVGVPLMASPMSANFVDLSQVPAAQEVRFTSADDAFTSVAFANGFRFPFANRTNRDVFVSTNGLISFGAGTSAPANTDLALASYAGPTTLAPFWDDLSLGPTGKVYWLVDGDTFPRRLIVQWNQLVIDADPGSSVTFQVQIFESGRARFVYGAMNGMQANGNNASVGFHTGPQGTGRSFRFNSTGTAVTANDEINLFTGDSTRTSGTLEARLIESGPMGFFAETSNGWVPVFASVRAVAPGSLVVNEALPVPSASASAGRWVELFNPTGEAASLEGLVLQSRSGAMMPFAFPAGVGIDAGSYLVVGESNDTVANGGAPIDVTWNMGEVPLASDDQAELRVGGTQADGGLLAPISTLFWTSNPDGGAVAGRSAQVAQRTVPALTCPRMQTFGSAGQLGTPGARNEGCFEYDLEPTPYQFEDISNTPPLVPTNGDLDEGVIETSLPAPFTHFGASQSSTLTISANGWLAFTSTTLSGSFNPTTPSSSGVRGYIAPFWDDLDLDAPGASIQMARVGNRTIIQWTNATLFLATGSLVTFQVKLFDSGVIEFHYRDVAPDARSQGSSATVWVERPSGTPVALPIAINQPLLQPNSAYRFTPRN